MRGPLKLVATLTAVLTLDVGAALSQSQGAPGAMEGSGSPTAVPLDSEATFGTLTIACTGVGQSKDNPKWKAYPVRIEFSNPAGDLLANGAATIARAGATLASVSCEGPWILARPASARAGGAYRLTGWLPGQGYKPITEAFTFPQGGQKVIDLRFAQP